VKKTEFEECDPLFFLSISGLIIIAVSLILTHQDGFLLKCIIAILGGTAGYLAPNNLFSKK